MLKLLRYDGIEYADERVSMRTKDAVYKIDANGKFPRTGVLISDNHLRPN